MRWAGVLISGVLGGLGGICYILAGVSEWKFENGVAGFGFLALAVMIFGQWKPTRIALAALLFGLFRALSNVYAGFSFLAALNIPGAVYNMMPYIISLPVLAFTSKNSRAPKAAFHVRRTATGSPAWIFTKKPELLCREPPGQPYKGEKDG